MHWQNLKNNKCPQCFKDFKISPMDSLIVCEVCGFKIGIEKMKQIINSQLNKKYNPNFRPANQGWGRFEE